MYVFLGNHKATDLLPVLDDAGNKTFDGDGEIAKSRQPIDGKRRIEIISHPLRGDVSEIFADITAPGGIWKTHAQDGSKPAWVASDDPSIATLLAAFYGCEIREPLPAGEDGSQAGSFAEALVSQNRAIFGDTQALRTNAGTDWLAGIMGNATANPATFMALTANASAASASDTTLAAEITTASGGLIRKACTYAHTGGTSSFTQTATFTANGNDSLPVTIAKIGLLNAASVGVLAFEILPTAATFTASGDACTYTYTITP